MASFETFNNTSINATLQKLADDGFWIGMQKNEWRWSDTGTVYVYISVFVLLSLIASLNVSLYVFVCLYVSDSLYRDIMTSSDPPTPGYTSTNLLQGR